MSTEAVDGWQHLIDLLLRRSLSSVSWFPWWLRSNIRVAWFETHFRSQGLPGLADCVVQVKPPNFAPWQVDACGVLRGVGSIPVESEVPLEPSKFQELS